MPTVENDIVEAVFKDVPPGPGLALLVAAQEHDRLDDYDIIELARAARRLASWATSAEYAAIATLAARRKIQGEKLGAWDSEIGDWVTDEIAAALTLSGGTAARQVVIAEELTQHLPRTYQALADGRIDADKAKAIASGLSGLSPQIAAQVEVRVLPDAPGHTCAQIRAAIRAAIREADPDAHTRRRKTAEEARRVELWDTDSGTADLAGRDLPAHDANAAANRVNAIAHGLKADGDPRTIDQLRADVYLALLRGHQPIPLAPPSAEPATATDAPTPQSAAPTSDGIPDGDVCPECTRAARGQDRFDPHTERTAADAVADAVRHQFGGLTDRLDRDAQRRGGQAALVREAARRIKTAIADLSARWCVTNTNDSGIVIRHGAESYRVPAAMRRSLQSRDATCRFPGCRRRATNCDIDHTVPYHKGGPTCPCNLAVLCRTHHRLKQRPEWQIIHIWPGVLLWIAPTGHWYITNPRLK